MMVLGIKHIGTCMHVETTLCCACCPPCRALPQATWKLAVAAAPSNRGLTPERYNKFGRDHFYQIPESPVGVVGAMPGRCCRQCAARAAAVGSSQQWMSACSWCFSR